MTVVAWDGHTLAADRQSTFYGLTVPTVKIRKLKNGLLAGAAGESGRCRELLEWIEEGMVKADFPKGNMAEAIAVGPSGERPMLFENGCPTPVRIDQRQFAIGGGRDFAMAAMLCGRDSVQAVQIAIQLSSGCGLGINSVNFSGEINFYDASTNPPKLLKSRQR